VTCVWLLVPAQQHHYCLQLLPNLAGFLLGLKLLLLLVSLPDQGRQALPGLRARQLLLLVSLPDQGRQALEALHQ
jgi:hypothetical protein